MFNLTATKFELRVEMFLQVAFGFYIMPDVRITSSSATRDKYGISFRVRTDSDIQT